jgi:glycosyltransferase involved in cell wall biosynthesis
MADLVVHPSAHEGNSYFVLETLACGVPLVSYNVGLMWELWEGGFEGRFGRILDRRERTPFHTLKAVRTLLEEGNLQWMGENARQMALAHSIDKFRNEWIDYVEKYELGHP